MYWFFFRGWSNFLLAEFYFRDPPLYNKFFFNGLSNLAVFHLRGFSTHKSKNNTIATKNNSVQYFTDSFRHFVIQLGISNLLESRYPPRGASVRSAPRRLGHDVESLDPVPLGFVLLGEGGGGTETK